MKKQIAFYQLVLDRSGSMEEIKSETIIGFNEQIQRIRDIAEHYPNQEVRVNLCLFNHQCHHLIDFQKPMDLQEINEFSYHPLGGTALFDAIGTSIKRLKKRIKSLEPDANYRVYFVIITDGYENSSTHFRYKDVSSAIKKLEKSGQWTFSYLGATSDAIEIALSLNIVQENAISFKKSDISAAFSESSNHIMSFMDNFFEG